MVEFSGMKKILITLLPVTILLAVLVSACSVLVPAAAEPDLLAALPNEAVTPAASATPAAILAVTESPAPAAVPTATHTPLPTDTPTSTPTPTPTLHPMMIEALRQGEYPGSEIVIEQELARGANYSRYYAYYLSEGLKNYALLTIPDGEMPPTGWPAIVFNHGYIPPEEYRTTERYIAYVDNLARQGYVILRIDYRGHDRSEGEARGAYGYPDYTIDVLNAVASLKQFAQVDPQRIGMWGHSMGGYLTLRAMVISPDIKVGVIWAGVVASYPDLLTRWRRTIPTPIPSESTPRRWRWSWVDEFGTAGGESRFLERRLLQQLFRGHLWTAAAAPCHNRRDRAAGVFGAAGRGTAGGGQDL